MRDLDQNETEKGARLVWKGTRRPGASVYLGAHTIRDALELSGLQVDIDDMSPKERRDLALTVKQIRMTHTSPHGRVMLQLIPDLDDLRTAHLINTHRRDGRRYVDGKTIHAGITGKSIAQRIHEESDAGVERCDACSVKMTLTNEEIRGNTWRAEFRCDNDRCGKVVAKVERSPVPPGRLAARKPKEA